MLPRSLFQLIKKVCLYLTHGPSTLVAHPHAFMLNMSETSEMLQQLKELTSKKLGRGRVTSEDFLDVVSFEGYTLFRWSNRDVIFGRGVMCGKPPQNCGRGCVKHLGERKGRARGRVVLRVLRMAGAKA